MIQCSWLKKFRLTSELMSKFVGSKYHSAEFALASGDVFRVMDEGNRDESLQRVHPGCYTVFPFSKQKHQQAIVNNGMRQELGELLSGRNKRVGGGAVQSTFCTNDDISVDKMSDGGKRIIDRSAEDFVISLLGPVVKYGADMWMFERVRCGC